MAEDLFPRTLFISNVTPGLTFEKATELFADTEKILHFRKRTTTKKIDNIQMDFCEYKPYVNYKNYINRLDPRQSIVVNWMPGCRMPYHMTTRVPYQ